jgi:hypothetical protein
VGGCGCVGGSVGVCFGFCFVFFWGTRVSTQDLMLGNCSTIWATPSDLSALVMLLNRVSLLPRTNLRHHSPYLCLPCS